MNLKKFALRGLITLALVVAVCMFFSRTVQTITTPKVQVITAEKGRFEEKLSYTAQVYFAETEPIAVSNPYGMEASQTHVQPGEFVNAGDLIFTLAFTNHGDRKAAFQAEYNTLSAQLMALDAANYGLPKSSLQNDLYAALLAANAALSDAIYHAQLAARQNDVALSGEASAWTSLTGLPDAVKLAIEQAVVAQTAYDETCATYHTQMINNPSNETIFTYINERNALLRDMDALMAQMIELDLALMQSTVVIAPRAGYIVSVDAEQLSYTMSAEGCEPILRVRSLGHTIADGTRADVVTDTLGTERSTVIETVGNYLHIGIPEDLIHAIPSFINGGVPVSINYRAKQATTLLSPSAVRGSGDECYVYKIEYTYGGILSTKSMRVVKAPVTIIERNDKTISIAEDLEGEEIAVREDRMLTDCQTVMEYVN